MRKSATDVKPATFHADVTSMDADEVTDYVSRWLNPVKVRPVENHSQVELTGNFGFTEDVVFWSSSFPYGAELLPQVDYDGFFFYSAVSGSLTAEMHGETLHSAGDQAIVGDGEQFRSIRFAPGRRDAGVAYTRRSLVQRLAYLLDAPVRNKLVFEPQVNSGHGPGAALASLIRCVNQTVFCSALSTAPLTASHLSTTLIDLALETLPHNYTAFLHEEPRSIAPYHVRRAIDYIKAHLADQVTVDGIAAQCGVSLRALQYGFQRFVGVTPGEYLRSCRLDAARRDFEACPEELIGTVARRYGFSNLGRFNKQFKAQFGETAAHVRERLRRAEGSVV